MRTVVELLVANTANSEPFSSWLADTAERRVHRQGEERNGATADVLVLLAGQGPTPAFPSQEDLQRPGIIVVGGVNDSAPGVDSWLPADVSQREFLQTVALVARLAAQARQVREMAQRQESLATLAASDPLTGLANRRTWDAQMPLGYSMAARAGQAACLAIFDVDNFKRVNDEAGHAAGDDLLRRAGRALKGSFRAEDLAARLGGDEFAVLFLVSSPAAAGPIVERARAAVNGELATGLPWRITASAGYAVAQSGDAAVRSRQPAPAELQAAADTALRAAKTAGRNQTCPAPS